MDDKPKPKTKIRKRFRPKIEELNEPKQEPLPYDVANEGDTQKGEELASDEAAKTVHARHQSEIFQREAKLKSELAVARGAKGQSHKKQSRWYDENGETISMDQLKVYQQLVCDFYTNFVVLDDDQCLELAAKLPKKLNNIGVQVGHRAVFPQVLDEQRKKIARHRVVEKMNRLQYVESDYHRGLKMDDDEGAQKPHRLKAYKEVENTRKDLVRTLIALNYNDHEMCEYLEVSAKQLSTIKKEVFYEELQIQKQMNNEEIFIQYKLQQMEIVKDIDVLVERFKKGKQLNALASILGRKTEIYDKIIERGQQLGVIEKEPEKAAFIVGGLDLNTASVDKLRDKLGKAQNEVERIMNRKNFLPTLEEKEIKEG